MVKIFHYQLLHVKVKSLTIFIFITTARMSRYHPLYKGESDCDKITHVTQLYQYVYFAFLYLFILRFCIL